MSSDWVIFCNEPHESCSNHFVFNFNLFISTLFIPKWNLFCGITDRPNTKSQINFKNNIFEHAKLGITCNVVSESSPQSHYIYTVITFFHIMQVEPATRMYATSFVVNQNVEPFWTRIHEFVFC